MRGLFSVIYFGNLVELVKVSHNVVGILLLTEWPLKF